MSSSVLATREQVGMRPLTLSVQQPSRLSGRFLPGAATRSSINVSCDGRHWAQMPVAEDPRGATFSLDLPTPAEPRDVGITVSADDGSPLGAIEATVLPRSNRFGLDAERVRTVHPLPLYSTPWMSFDGARIVVSGAHLPPAGDPGQLSVRFGPGVAYDIAYPLAWPDFANHFWYWPNADVSGFHLTIDLASCEAGSDPFTFEFVYPQDGMSPAESELRRIGRKVYVPSRLDSAICFPRDANQLTRVQTWSDDKTVNFTGYSAFRTIEDLFGRHGLRDAEGVRVLDWGCGHGRVSRHMIREWPRSRIAGGDIDRQNVDWCREHLGDEFVTLPLRPESSIADASFDGVFGISVMTHLTADMQQAWLKEIARILKPGGIALISFSGFAAAAFSSIDRTRQWWDAWIETGFDDHKVDTALEGKIEDGTYYRDTLQSPAYTVGAWQRHLDLVEIYPSALGYQDVAVLRRPGGKAPCGRS